MSSCPLPQECLSNVELKMLCFAAQGSRQAPPPGLPGTFRRPAAMSCDVFWKQFASRSNNSRICMACGFATWFLMWKAFTITGMKPDPFTPQRGVKGSMMKGRGTRENCVDNLHYLILVAGA